MKNIYLLDTNIISNVTKPEPSSGIITNLEFHAGTCAISSITWFELLNGIELLPESKKKKILQSYIFDYVRPSFPVIPYDENAALINSTITGKLIPLGQTPPVLDTQIASIAIANNMILVTQNLKDFEAVKNNFNLMLEKW